MNIRTRTAALALTAVTGSAVLGACAGLGGTPSASVPAPATAVQQDGKPAGLTDGALRGQVEGSTALTMIIQNNTDETWNLDGQYFTGVVNTKFADVVAPHTSSRAVVNSLGLDGSGIAASFFNADMTSNLQTSATVPLFGKDTIQGHTWSWREQDRYKLIPDPRFMVTTSDISGYTPTVTVTISYA